MFTPLKYPKTTLKLTRKGDAIYVWDIFRKKKLLLTPEEWVRQHVLHFFVEEKGVPASLIASEYPITVNTLQRRCDGVIFNQEGQPVLILECKAPQVKITEKTFYQIAQYNFKLRVEWLVLTNGIDTFIARINNKEQKIVFSEEIPSYSEIIRNIS